MPLSHRAGIVLPGDQFLIALVYVDADNRVSGCVCRKILSIIDFASRFPPRHLLWPTWPSLLCHFASNASGYAASGACPGMSFCIERIVIRPISTQYQTAYPTLYPDAFDVQMAPGASSLMSLCIERIVIRLFWSMSGSAPPGACLLMSLCIERPSVLILRPHGRARMSSTT